MVLGDSGDFDVETKGEVTERASWKKLSGICGVRVKCQSRESVGNLWGQSKVPE